MSYEGSIQLLCENGHYDETDYDYGNGISPSKCSFCGAKWKEENHVDETHGCTSTRYAALTSACECGRVEVIEVTPPKYCTCTCGHKHEIAPGTYKFGAKETVAQHGAKYEQQTSR